MKKFLITFLAIAIICIFSLPSALCANDNTYNFSITVEKTATGFESGVFEYEMYFIIFDPSDPPDDFSGMVGGSIGTIGHAGGSFSFNDIYFVPIPDNLVVSGYIVESGTNGATGIEISLDSPPTAIDGIINSGTWISFSYDENTITAYFDNIKVAHPEPEPKPKPEPESEPIIRTHPMTCWQVWINEDNNFEFIFWWEYKNNNWVQIFDMEDNLVWEIDFPKGKPRFEVDLPDGMYKVQTFHEESKILQEFIIGKHKS